MSLTAQITEPGRRLAGCAMVGAAIGAQSVPVAAMDVSLMLSCRQVGMGFEKLAEAIDAGPARPAGTVHGIKLGFFGRHLDKFQEGPGPAATKVFDVAGADAPALLAAVEACVRDNTCTDDLSARVAQVGADLPEACMKDMRGGD